MSLADFLSTSSQHAGLLSPLFNISDPSIGSSTLLGSSLSRISLSDLSIGSSTVLGSVADFQTEMTCGLEYAEQALDTVKARKSAVDVTKGVIDTLGPTVIVCLLSVCPILR
jgi:hypothetical protein